MAGWPCDESVELSTRGVRCGNIMLPPPITSSIYLYFSVHYWTMFTMYFVQILYQFKILKTWCAISSWGWILLHFMAEYPPVIWNWLSNDAPGVASTVLPFSARSILTSCWSEPSIVYNTFTKLRQGARSYITLWALPFNSGAGGRWLFLHKQVHNSRVAC